MSDYPTINFSRLAGSPNDRQHLSQHGVSPAISNSDFKGEHGSTIGHFRKIREQRLSVLSLTSQAREAANDVEIQIVKLKRDFNLRIDRFSHQCKINSSKRL